MRLTLTTKVSGEECPRADIPHGAEAVETWLDNDGNPSGFGFSLAGRHWMRLPGVGTFGFGPDSGEVAVTPEPGVTQTRIEDAFHRTVAPMVLQTSGRDVLHASAVLTPCGVVALCGVSETGKSTLAYGLSRRGLPLWADDAVAFEVREGAVEASPLPYRMRLSPESRAYFSRDGAPVCDDAFTLPHNAPLGMVCVLERVRSDHSDCVVRSEKLTGAAAFSAVLPHAYCFTLRDPQRKRQMLEHYLALVTRLPVLHVRFRRGLAHLPAIMDHVQRAAAAVAR